MCAILDNSVRDMVFVSKPATAAKKFREWIESGRLRLVVGGHLKKELTDKESVKDWLSEGERKGFVEFVPDGKVDALTVKIHKSSVCKSNDAHVLALAQVSGARLLYANDVELEEDFRKKQLIDKPRGVLYPKGTIKGGHHKWLHEHRDICRKP